MWRMHNQTVPESLVISRNDYFKKLRTLARPSNSHQPSLCRFTWCHTRPPRISPARLYKTIIQSQAEMALHSYWGREWNWLLVVPQTHPQSVCCSSVLAWGFSVNNTFSSAFKTLPVPHPLSLWLKSVFSPWFHSSFNLHRAHLHSFYCFSRTFLTPHANVSSSRGTLRCLVRPCPAPHADPLSVLYSGLQFDQVGSPPVTLTGGGFLRCQ